MPAGNDKESSNPAELKREIDRKILKG